MIAYNEISESSLSNDDATLSSSSQYLIKCLGKQSLPISKSMYDNKIYRNIDINTSTQFHFNQQFFECGLFNLHILFELLDKYLATDEEDKLSIIWKDMKNDNIGNWKIKSLSRLKYLHDTHVSHENDFELKCDKNNATFAEVNFLEGTIKKSTIARTIFIFTIEKDDKHKGDVIQNVEDEVEDEVDNTCIMTYIVVAWLKDIQKSSYLPYPLYEYEKSSNKTLNMDIVHYQNIRRPAYIIPGFIPGKCNGWFHELTIPHIWNIQYYSIPADQVTRNLCPGFVEYQRNISVTNNQTNNINMNNTISTNSSNNVSNSGDPNMISSSFYVTDEEIQKLISILPKLDDNAEILDDDNDDDDNDDIISLYLYFNVSK